MKEEFSEGKGEKPKGITIPIDQFLPDLGSKTPPGEEPKEPPFDPESEFIAEEEEISKSSPSHSGSSNVEYFFNIFIYENIRECLDLLFKKFSTSSHLGSIRGISQRVFLENGNATNLEQLVKNFLSKYNPEDLNRNAFLKKWLQAFDLGDRLTIETIGDGFGYQIFLWKGDRKQLLADNGFGHSQFLPILLQVFLLSKYSESQVLMIEEPETNLHPQLQAKLADFFVDASREFKLQFILETHSEYMIRKLQVLTAQGDLTPDDTAIYYIFPPNEVPKGRQQVQRLRIESDGGLDGEFGPGFFDEALTWKLELMKLKNRNN
jgi:hypothetical protein